MAISNFSPEIQEIALCQETRELEKDSAENATGFIWTTLQARQEGFSPHLQQKLKHTDSEQTGRNTKSLTLASIMQVS